MAVSSNNYCASGGLGATPTVQRKFSPLKDIQIQYNPLTGRCSILDHVTVTLENGSTVRIENPSSVEINGDLYETPAPKPKVVIAVGDRVCLLNGHTTFDVGAIYIDHQTSVKTAVIYREEGIQGTPLEYRIAVGALRHYPYQS